MNRIKNFFQEAICIVLGVILLVTNNREASAEGLRLVKPSLENSDPHGVIEWTRKVYSNGKWNGSPDIAHWRGHYYVAVNQGTLHAGTNGPGIVLRSANLKEWEQIYTTTGPSNGSAVDCKLLALPDRLIFYYVYMQRPGDPHVAQKPDARNYVESRAVTTEDGKNWSKSQRVHEPLHNFWKPKVHDGVIYVASDTFNLERTDYVTAAEEQNPLLYRVDLLRSTDGLKWEKMSTIVEGNAGHPITETALIFRPDGELWAFIRQNILSRSRPPYKNWTTQSAKISGGGIGGPEMISVGNDVYASGRFYAYLANHGPTDSPQTNKIATSLWKYGETVGKFERIADFPKPAYADMGYTGFVETADGIFMVYYSGHAHGETDEARSTKADIYLSKLKIGN